MVSSGIKKPLSQLKRPAVAGGAVALALAVGLVAVPLSATADSDKFVTFNSFIDATRDSSFQDLTASSHDVAISDAHAFAQMRGYVLDLYSGAKVRHSYVQDGSYVDCVTKTSQPGLRATGSDRLAKPPKLKKKGHPDPDGAKGATTMARPHSADAYGNALACGKGTIPMQRVTLDRLSHFKNLAAFFAKTPGGAPDARANEHKYAHARQDVGNHGGQSSLNLWNPSGDFTLSQQWYTNGSGTGLQTVEGGWVHYPDKFGDSSALFIYHTPDGYQTGCYNLDCAAFVQTSSDWTLGAQFSNYSTKGGDQYEYSQQWQLKDGNWWLFLGSSTDNMTSVGYFPASVYNNGTVTNEANNVDYGGEVYTGGTNWPQMGSGESADKGWQQAAYQRTLFYLGSDGSTNWAALNPNSTLPCYTIDNQTPSDGTNWTNHFYYGGPGGGGC
ncbi:MAG TPA: neprosin family prolyl endopeptidase [Stackebrandtia sp.]|uniref:neprosin family prolyl endopeptidase n=1 Tax=Stackebrandtia sp. TaxID=2023065 RepID=UPI002D52812A|nr:neprosin family prolyl endopeptidase [Stackebrandtia sp.]HZE39219.1 neprosin family prolyl endopeptidase [Stackebrandtia sp.]